MTIRSIKSVAVFCGSNFGASEAFADGARALGGALGEAGITIIYGGTVKGLMGVVADAALEAGGSVHGVITESLHQRGQSHAGLTRHEIVETLRSRKERMVELSDAFIALPGGIGTIEELMEVWTMNQLSEIDKPVGLLNSAGFFDAFRPYGRDEVPAGRAQALDLCRHGCERPDRQAAQLYARRGAEMAIASIRQCRRPVIGVVGQVRQVRRSEPR
ncbi:TIGR00730 family Rossman fold protein [Rhizobium leguminosarum]|uniref:LOG family protein n=1 Tax=Rhizobium leguminosarum TaxID=384 RepID=UPI0021B0919F|nr:TIGR00730 family Rossman fold protein [Rhizobium leguminosarum]